MRWECHLGATTFVYQTILKNLKKNRKKSKENSKRNGDRFLNSESLNFLQARFFWRLAMRGLSHFFRLYILSLFHRFSISLFHEVDFGQTFASVNWKKRESRLKVYDKFIAKLLISKFYDTDFFQKCKKKPLYLWDNGKH